MSTETQENIVSPADDEQITKPESATKTTKASTKKPEDPKKFAAEKKLAEQNRIERQALNRELKRESEEEAEAKTEVGDSSSWIPNTSFTTVLSVVGIGLTIFDLYMRYRKGEGSREDVSEVRLMLRVDEKSSEAKAEVKAEENMKREAVEKIQDTYLLEPSKKNTQNVPGQSSKIKCGMD